MMRPWKLGWPFFLTKALSSNSKRHDAEPAGEGEAASLVCCLAGFDAVSIGTARGIVQLFSLQLSAKWRFQADLHESCDLIICDVDTHAGEQAWRKTAGRIPARAMVTFALDVSEGLILLKPLRADGPDGLIRVLNEGARIRSVRACATQQGSLGAIAPDDAPMPVSKAWSLGPALSFVRRWFSPFHKTLAAGQSCFADAAPVGANASSGSTSLGKYRDLEAVAEGRLDDDAFARFPIAASQHLPHRRSCSTDDTTTLVAVPVLTGAIVPYTAMERVEARPSCSALQVSGGFALVTEAVEENLLTALRRFRSLSQVAVIRFDDMPTICVTSATEMFYSLASLQSLYEAPVVKLTPARVTIARNSHQGRTEAQSYYQSGSQSYFVSLPGAPLRHLFWVATLRCGGSEEVERYQDAFFHVRVMPEFALLPHERHHVTWCNLLARQPVTLAILAKATGHTKGAAAIFLAACDELGILERKEANAASGICAIASDRPAARSFVQRLGLKRD